MKPTTGKEHKILSELVGAKQITKICAINARDIIKKGNSVVYIFDGRDIAIECKAGDKFKKHG